MADCSVDSQPLMLAPIVLRDWLGCDSEHLLLPLYDLRENFFPQKVIKSLLGNKVAQLLVKLPATVRCKQWPNLRFILKTEINLDTCLNIVDWHNTLMMTQQFVQK